MNLFSGLFNKDTPVGNSVRVLKRGRAARVIFFYPGEEGTYVDNADVILLDNGVVHLRSNQEETSTHLQNCEILWRLNAESDDRASKVRLLRPKGSSGEASESQESPDPSPEPR